MTTKRLTEHKDKQNYQKTSQNVYMMDNYSSERNRRTFTLNTL